MICFCSGTRVAAGSKLVLSGGRIDVKVMEPVHVWSTMKLLDFGHTFALESWSIGELAKFLLQTVILKKLLPNLAQFSTRSEFSFSESPGQSVDLS